MLSTLDSNVLIEVKNLNVMFQLKFNRDESLRGQFVELLSNPVDFLFKDRDVLHILNQVSFSASKGDRIAIIGKNGAGKTTLCRCLAGIYKNKGIAIKPQKTVRAILDPHAVIFPELTGRENAKILTELIYSELSPAEREKILTESLEFSGLKEFLDTPFRHFSSGMQSRLCLSVATAVSSDIFILDEVFEAADKVFKEKISARIVGLIEKSGVVFFVSHSEEQVRRVCNKALFVKSGRVQFFGDLDKGLELYNQSANE